ncbi:MAG: quinol monooxygenase YgiN [Moritella sp.]|jgi:quinol monooxygenase YgiN
MKALTCMAKIVAAAGAEEQVKTALMGLIEPTRKEAGCINYDMHIDNENPAVFMFHETWRSEADLNTHSESQHMKACFGAITDLLAEVDVRRLTKVGE